jgi:hypothetical protein
VLGSFCAAVQLAASQGLSSMKLVKFEVPATVTITYLKYLLRIRYILSTSSVRALVSVLRQN